MGIRRKTEPIIWTEQTMQDKLQFFRSNPRYVLKNLYMFGWECDLLFLSKSGIWTEIEIKVSRSDFLTDLKKVEKHAVLADEKNKIKRVTCKNVCFNSHNFVSLFRLNLNR